MEERPSSSPARASSPRPSTFRKRSNSLPITEALGCSTPEAELILAEGRAAINRRQPSVRQRGRRKRSDDSGRSFNPQDHLAFLDQSSNSDPARSSKPALSWADIRNSRHTRMASNATDDSTSTITGPAPKDVPEISRSPSSPGAVLGSYSANLASFIQTQLNSIPSYKTGLSAISPRSCPDFSCPPQSPPPPSPAIPKSPRRPVESTMVLEMPPVRPPLRSAFSAWSSTDDEAEDEDVPDLPSDTQDLQRHFSKPNTPSILGYYANASESSFLLPSTPAEEDPQRRTISGFTFPNPSTSTSTDDDDDASSQSHSTSFEDSSPSSDTTHPQLTASASSAAASFSSVSTGSYFEYKRTKYLVPDAKARILAATAPHANLDVNANAKVGSTLTAISPFEGGEIANVHDILVESQHRVVVEGLSFEMLRDLHVPREEGMRRVETPC